MNKKEFYNLPVPTMSDVVKATGLKVKGTKTTCPLCSKSDRDRPMSISHEVNWFNCHRCGASGSAVALYALIRHGIEDANAVKKQFAKLKAEIYGIDLDQLEQYDIKDLKIEERKAENLQRLNKDLKLADIKTLHLAYKELIEFKPTSVFMEQDLKRRGFSDEDIKRIGYAPTLTKKESITFIQLMKQKGIELDGVAGFYKNKYGEIEMNCSLQGYFIPFRNVYQVIRGLQIAVDPNYKNQKELSKYMWFSSSSQPEGTTVGSITHYVGNIDSTLFLTEGATKANLFNKFTQLPCLAIAGVNAINDIMAQLNFIKGMFGEIKQIVLLFDMDKLNNIHVQNALNKLSNKLSQEGLIVETLDWDSRYKGIDDYLFHLHQNKEIKPFIEEKLYPFYYGSEREKIKNFQFNHSVLNGLL